MSTLAKTAPSSVQRPSLVTALAAGAGFAAVFTAFGSFNLFNGESESFDGQALVNWAVCLAGIIVAALVCWRASAGAVTRGDHPALARRALVFGILSAISLPVFWLGIYGPFAAGAVLMGTIALSSPSSAAVKVMGAVGILFAVLGTVVCALNNVVG